MPCEACNVQFTVFRRKKTCYECRRLFCNTCAVKRRDRTLCERCVVFTRRPLSKVELLKLKPKDLIFFLQSKHISTTGCVEKEELVNLVLIHVNNSTEMPSSATSADESCANPFDQIKQTCQNLFTSFTDKISNDLNFDLNKSSANSSAANTNTPTSPTTNPPTPSTSSASSPLSSSSQQQQQQQHQQHIFSQPRSTRRPSAGQSSSSGATTSFASSTRHTPTTSVPPPMTANNSSSSNQQRHNNNDATTAGSSSSTNSSSIHSPAPLPPKRTRLPTPTTFSEPSVCSPPPTPQINACDCRHNNTGDGDVNDDNNVDDDDDVAALTDPLETAHVINEFRRSQSQHSAADFAAASPTTMATSPSVVVVSPVESMASQSIDEELIVAADATSNLQLLPTTAAAAGDSDDGSSSFEDLATTTTTTTTTATLTQQPTTTSPPSVVRSPSDAEHWQIIDHPTMDGTVNAATSPHETPTPSPNLAIPSASQPTPFSSAPVSVTPQRRRGANRRRSESALLSGRSPRQHFSIDVDDDEPQDGDDVNVGDDNGTQIAQAAPTNRSSGPPTCCDRCGKRKASIRVHVDRFRQQLESQHVDEAEMRRELAAFLVYLEQSPLMAATTTRSATASSTAATSPTQDVAGAVDDGAVRMDSGDGVDEDDDDDFSFGEDDGIHVYATDDPMDGSGGLGGRSASAQARQFINLTDIQDSSDLDELNVKQLKEILMLNRVDYKGCCEKNELLERVKRLWQECSSCPDVDKLPGDDLCKICMDAPIECVMLECGHMATCTGCGKVLNECPICRQYIVRVVRFFRA